MFIGFVGFFVFFFLFLVFFLFAFKLFVAFLFLCNWRIWCKSCLWIFNAGFVLFLFRWLWLLNIFNRHRYWIRWNWSAWLFDCACLTIWTCCCWRDRLDIWLCLWLLLLNSWRLHWSCLLFFCWWRKDWCKNCCTYLFSWSSLTFIGCACTCHRCLACG